MRRFIEMRSFIKMQRFIIGERSITYTYSRRNHTLIHTYMYAIIGRPLPTSAGNIDLLKLYGVGSLFRQVYVQTGLCSERSMFREVYVQTGLCSDRSMFRHVYVQTCLCSDMSMFRQVWDHSIIT